MQEKFLAKMLAVSVELGIVVPHKDKKVFESYLVQNISREDLGLVI